MQRSVILNFLKAVVVFIVIVCHVITVLYLDNYNVNLILKCVTPFIYPYLFSLEVTAFKPDEYFADDR